MVELVWDGKYDSNGKRTAPLRLKLPFQTVETVNESLQQRQMALDLFSAGKQSDWRNRLIWGDKKYVLPALLDEFTGKVDLIYIDPPFNVGADFSYNAAIPDSPETDENEEATFFKQPNIIEQKAYRDTWGQGHDSYLQWFYETVVLLRDLLSEKGSIYVHLDWHLVHYAKVVMDDVFGQDNFQNEVYWYYYNKLHGATKDVFPRATDTLLYYVKDRNSNYTFHHLAEPREKPIKKLKYSFIGGKIVNDKDEHGKTITYISTERQIDNVWRMSTLQPADKTENLRYPTQKPETLLERVLQASSNEGDLVLDCFCGSGTTAAVAEKLGRRWITCDLGRFAIHTTRKRLLSIPGVKPFEVQNLGKYERQAWQAAEFGGEQEAALVVAQYRRFLLDLYHARPIHGYAWLHGLRDGRLVHIGAVDSPVTPNDVRQIAIEFHKATGTGADAPSIAAVDVLGWDFAFELNEVAKLQASEAGINMRFIRIPREVLEQKAVDQGDIKFFELAALTVDVKLPPPNKPLEIALEITDFTIPPDDVPAEVQKAINHFSQWIDYWAVDWDNKGDTFHNMWQAYRTRQSKTLTLKAAHLYDQPGEYTVMVKAIDILGNDTTKVLKVRIL
jgi:DNA modification methylase